MKRVSPLLLGVALMCLGFAGCAEKSSTTTEKTVSTPSGTTTTTTETEVKKTGENPPPANP